MTIDDVMTIDARRQTKQLAEIAASNTCSITLHNAPNLCQRAIAIDFKRIHTIQNAKHVHFKCDSDKTLNMASIISIQRSLQIFLKAPIVIYV